MRSQEKLHLVPEGRNSRDEETKARMRVLWTILIVLVIALIAAIVYEIVLGYGLQQTGSERMEEIGGAPAAETEPGRENRFMTEPETESKTESGTESGTDSAAGMESDAESVTEDESQTQRTADPQKEIERIQNSRQGEGTDEDDGEEAPTLAGVGGL